jgi:hypothetical protein
MKRMSLMLTMLALAAMLALPACSTKRGPSPESSGTNNSGSSMGMGSGY